MQLSYIWLSVFQLVIFFFVNLLIINFLKFRECSRGGEEGHCSNVPVNCSPLHVHILWCTQRYKCTRLWMPMLACIRRTNVAVGLGNPQGLLRVRVFLPSRFSRPYRFNFLYVFTRNIRCSSNQCKLYVQVTIITSLLKKKVVFAQFCKENECECDVVSEIIVTDSSMLYY